MALLKRIIRWLMEPLPPRPVEPWIAAIFD